MKALYKIVALVGVSAAMTSCFDKSKPNYQFFPNMYESVAYETYSQSDAFKGGKEGLKPAHGSIKRGFEPYAYENTPAGYMQAKSELKSPLDSLSVNPEKGAELYNIYCAICHGEKGDGQGNLVKREKFLGVPNYADRDVTEGSIFHVITYGLNAMGSHANQLSQQERWMVVDHVLKLRGELKK